MKHSKWIGGASGLVLLGALILPNAAAISASAAPAAPKAIGGQVATNQAATLAYWTPARRAAAKDGDVLTVAAPQTEAIHAVHTGKPGAVAGRLPGGVKASATPRTASPALTNAFNYPFPYDSFNVPPADYKSFPWSVNGKIFFTNDGVGYVCSGTVVPSHNSTQNEVWTAGHCLVNTESLDENVDTFLEFIPAYNGTYKTTAKQAPYGIYVWNGAWETNTAWLDNRDLSEDEAAFTVGTNSNGQTLGNVVGWAGFAWNYSTDEQFVAFGYPAASPYKGNLQITDIGASAVLDTGVGGAGSPPIGIGNPMTGGSSGGGWMIGWTQTGTGYVFGHNDYKYNSQPLSMYSPYQDTLSNDVRCFGATSC